MSETIIKKIQTVKKALEQCLRGECRQCHYMKYEIDCEAVLQTDALALLKIIERMIPMKINKPSAHAAICAELTDLYTRKNADYGDSFAKSFDEYGFAMPCIRLDDKLNRMKSLTKGHSYRVDESVRDTLMDLANYAIMTVLELDAHADDTDPGPRSIMVEAAPDA